MKEGNVSNNLRELFPDTKGGCKTDCEVSPSTFFCYKWCQYRGVFLSQLSIMMAFFVELVNGSQQLTTFAKSSILDVRVGSESTFVVVSDEHQYQ